MLNQCGKKLDSATISHVLQTIKDDQQKFTAVLNQCGNKLKNKDIVALSHVVKGNKILSPQIRKLQTTKVKVSAKRMVEQGRARTNTQVRSAAKSSFVDKVRTSRTQGVGAGSGAGVVR